MAKLHLRRIAIFVDEPDPGLYYWVIGEESKHEASVWEDICASEESFDTWRAAFDAGNIVLLEMVPNQKTGPLSAGDHENISPAA